MGLTRAQVKDMLMHYQQMGVKRLVALRGDLPSGMVQAGDLVYASELVAFARAETGEAFHIEVAAYPEFHPQALTPHEDVLNLKRKYEAGANSAITQYFFNPDAYFYYVDDCAKQGIHFPIVPGIMPITQFSRLARFSDQCGAEIPRWIRKRLEVYENDPAAIKAFGLEVVYTLCEQLTKGGAPGLHFYTLNKSEAVAELFHLLPVTQSALALV
jgi:methylenetetrahydrofolate reductase (NADPH)